MKIINKLAIILLIFWIIVLVPNPLTSMMIAKMYGPKYIQEIDNTHYILTATRTILSMSVRIGVAVWLFIQATRDKTARWMWSLLGINFSIGAAVLYILVQQVEAMKLKRPTERPYEKSKSQYLL